MVKNYFIPIISEEKKKEENPGSVEFQAALFPHQPTKILFDEGSVSETIPLFPCLPATLSPTLISRFCKIYIRIVSGL